MRGTMLEYAARTVAWEDTMRMPLAIVLTFALTFALAVAACSTPERRAERMQAAMAQRMAVHGPECARLGHAHDTDPWRRCVIEQSSRAELDQISGYHMGWRHGLW
ncbi:MAG: hypothetical protein ACRYF6_04595 [Janthinobacterium lividum]